MGGCCSGAGDPEEDLDITKRGPSDNRGCTDVHCLLLYVVYVSGLFVLLWSVMQVSDVRFLIYGVDHYGNLCGVDESGHNMASKPYTYYPDLHNDFQEDPSLRSRYGVCVAQCPPQGGTIDDYGDKIREHGMATKSKWYCPLPSLPIAGRCVPYNPPSDKKSTLMCAYPACKKPDPGVEAKTAMEVCGLAQDGTDKDWLMEKPDEWVLFGWQKLEGKSNDTIKKLTAIATKTGEDKELQATCEVTATRQVSVKLEQNAPIFNLIMQYTGYIFRHCLAVYNNIWVILGIGLGGSLVASFLVICLFAVCAHVILAVLTLLMFFVLSVMDYILFVQAGFATGNTGLKILETFQNTTHALQVGGTGDMASGLVDKMHLLQSQTDDTMIKIYGFLAVFILLVIVVLFIVVCASMKNFKILIGLLNEAARTIREMPMLLIFPFFNLLSVLVSCFFIMSLMVGIATMKATEVIKFVNNNAAFLAPWFEDPPGFQFNVNGSIQKTQFDKTQEYMMWGVVFGFLWVYYYHVAFFTCTISGAISHWYFYREDPERSAGTGIHSEGYFPGRPVLISCGRVCRYHLGSLAKGSFIMALVTLPRIILEYVDQQTKGAQETNPVITVLIKAARCCLCCLEKCLQFLTEYAYCYVMITGHPFCTSARKSFGTFMSYPVQVAMDKMASTALGYVACVTVPACMAVLTYAFSASEPEWISIVGMVVMLAFVTTRLAVGVYDVTITTLFLCLMRDCKHYGGKYMTPALSQATGLPEKEGSQRSSQRSSRRTSASRSTSEVEMGDPPGENG